MTSRSEEDDQQSVSDPKADATELLTLFNFYWLKFLSKKRVIDQQRKLLEHEVTDLETEEKISSTRNAINDLSSS
jgi:hypothetical protein